jgi:hypothetical protein
MRIGLKADRPLRRLCDRVSRINHAGQAAIEVMCAGWPTTAIVSQRGKAALMFKLLSFDVYGTLINTPPTNVKAFRVIVEEAGAPNVDALAFYQFWESRNIAHYREPYRSYREIGELSLEEAFENFGIAGGRADLIERYFDLFPEMQLYRTCCLR